jgi:hypothetical protein
MKVGQRESQEPVDQERCAIFHAIEIRLAHVVLSPAALLCNFVNIEKRQQIGRDFGPDEWIVDLGQSISRRDIKT